MRRGYLAGIKAAPACAQMLVGTNEIGRAGRCVEALRKNSDAVEEVFTNDGPSDAVGHTLPSVTVVGAPLDPDEFEAVAQVLQQVARRPIGPLHRRVGQ